MHGPHGHRAATLGLDVAIGLATVAGIVAVASRAVEFGSTAGHWTFAYVAPADARLAVVACVLAPLTAALHELGRRAVASRPVATTAAVFAGGVMAQLVVRGLYLHPMRGIVLSEAVNGFYGAAGRVTPGALLRDFDRVATQLPQHPRVNMPGKTLLYHALRAVTDDAAVIAIAVVLLSSASGLLLYAIATRALGSRALGLDAMTLWMLLPSKVAFLPMLNVVSPLPALAVVWCLVRRAGAPSPLFAAAAGVLLYATVFFDPLALWIVLAFAPLAARGSGRLRTAATLAAAAIAAHVTVVQATGFDVGRRFVQMTGIARDFNRTWNRPYDVWLVANAKDVVLALGPAMTVAFLAATAAAAWQVARAVARRAWPRAVEPGPAIALAAATSLAAVLAIGLNRGEVARLWIPLFVPAVVAIAWLAGDDPPARWLVVGGTVAWAVLTVATVGYCVP